MLSPRHFDDATGQSRRLRKRVAVNFEDAQRLEEVPLPAHATGEPLHAAEREVAKMTTAPRHVEPFGLADFFALSALLAAWALATMWCSVLPIIGLLWLAGAL